MIIYYDLLHNTAHRMSTSNSCIKLIVSDQDKGISSMFNSVSCSETVHYENSNFKIKSYASWLTKPNTIVSPH